MSTFKSTLPSLFCKIPHYRKTADPIHLIRNVVALEKLDGTHTRWVVPAHATHHDQLLVGGRTLWEHDPDFRQPFLRTALLSSAKVGSSLLEFVQESRETMVLYGETCGRGIQSSGHIYGNTPRFVLFAATIGNTWLSFHRPTELRPTELRPTNQEEHQRSTPLPSLVQLASGLGIPLTPCLYQGEPIQEQFDALLDRPSAFALKYGSTRHAQDSTHEGIVLWPDPVLLDSSGQLLIAKHKHPRRREALENTHDSPETVHEYAERVIQPERLIHAQSYLEERGRWPSEQQEQAQLLAKRVVQDVAREQSDYQEQILRHGKQALRAALEQVTHQRFNDKLSTETHNR
jgi:hypothetical protein